MAANATPSESLRMIWIFPDDLAKILNSAPTLNVTRELRKAGWHVDTLVGAAEEGLHEILGVEVMGIARPEKYLVRQLVYHGKVLRFVMKNWKKTDVILFKTMSAPWILPLRLLRFMRGGKGPLLVLDTRTVPMEGAKGTVKDRLRGRYDLLMNALANRFTDGQTVITPQMAEVLHIPKNKLWGIWPSGVNIEEFLPAREKRRWPQGDEPVQIGYIGIFSTGRDLFPLCRAVERANQEGMCFELTMVGDGRDRESLAAFASQTQGRVRVLDRVLHDQIPMVLATMHVGALPFPDEMKFRVSSFIKMFEYLGSGMPVLATRIVAHTDVIGSQKCAFWAEDASEDGLMAALREIWEHRADLAEMGRVAGDTSRQYSWAASAQKLSSALQNGMARKGGK